MHKSHCIRVQKGAEWGREDEREAIKAGRIVIESRVELPGGQHGRVISLRAAGVGKASTKVSVI